jgi:hypothetical protein
MRRKQPKKIKLERGPIISLASSPDTPVTREHCPEKSSPDLLSAQPHQTISKMLNEILKLRKSDSAIQLVNKYISAIASAIAGQCSNYYHYDNPQFGVNRLTKAHNENFKTELIQLIKIKLEPFITEFVQNKATPAEGGGAAAAAAPADADADADAQDMLRELDEKLTGPTITSLAEKALNHSGRELGGTFTYDPGTLSGSPVDLETMLSTGLLSTPGGLILGSLVVSREVTHFDSHLEDFERAAINAGNTNNPIETRVKQFETVINSGKLDPAEVRTAQIWAMQELYPTLTLHVQEQKAQIDNLVREVESNLNTINEKTQPTMASAETMASAKSMASKGAQHEGGGGAAAAPMLDEAMEAVAIPDIEQSRIELGEIRQNAERHHAAILNMINENAMEALPQAVPVQRFDPVTGKQLHENTGGGAAGAVAADADAVAAATPALAASLSAALEELKATADQMQKLHYSVGREIENITSEEERDAEIRNATLITTKHLTPKNAAKLGFDAQTLEAGLEPNAVYEAVKARRKTQEWLWGLLEATTGIDALVEHIFGQEIDNKCYEYYNNKHGRTDDTKQVMDVYKKMAKDMYKHGGKDKPTELPDTLEGFKEALTNKAATPEITEQLAKYKTDCRLMKMVATKCQDIHKTQQASGAPSAQQAFRDTRRTFGTAGGYISPSDVTTQISEGIMSNTDMSIINMSFERLLESCPSAAMKKWKENLMTQANVSHYSLQQAAMLGPSAISQAVAASGGREVAQPSAPPLPVPAAGGTAAAAAANGGLLGGSPGAAAQGAGAGAGADEAKNTDGGHKPG